MIESVDDSLSERFRFFTIFTSLVSNTGAGGRTIAAGRSDEAGGGGGMKEPTLRHNKRERNSEKREHQYLDMLSERWLSGLSIGGGGRGLSGSEGGGGGGVISSSSVGGFEGVSRGGGGGGVLSTEELFGEK